MKKIFILFLFLSTLIFLPDFNNAAKAAPVGPQEGTLSKPSDAKQETGTTGTSGTTTDYKIQLKQPTGTFKNVDQIVSIIFNLVIYGSGIAFLILFLIGGLQYLTSTGNEDQAGKAKKLLLDAVIGLIIVLSAWAAGTFILGRFGISV